MAEIVNLRRVRKRRQKDERSRQANEKAERALDAGRIEAGNSEPTDMQ